MAKNDVRTITKRTGPRTTLATAWAVMVATLAAVLSVGTAAQPAIPTAAPFDMTGFIQSATLDNPSDLFSGGTITVNNIRMIVPRNTLLQFPATGVTWQEAFALAPAPYTGLQTGLALSDVPRPATTYEVHVVGNRVGGQHIVGLLFLSQQSLHAGQGFITAIDYVAGEMRVGGVAANPALDTRVRINDPLGRFGRSFSPDVRFTIDEDNPTIHTGNFYPMCVLDPPYWRRPTTRCARRRTVRRIRPGNSRACSRCRRPAARRDPTRG